MHTDIAMREKSVSICVHPWLNENWEKEPLMGSGVDRIYGMVE